MPVSGVGHQRTYLSLARSFLKTPRLSTPNLAGFDPKVFIQGHYRGLHAYSIRPAGIAFVARNALELIISFSISGFILKS